MEHFGDFDLDLLPGCLTQRRPRGSEDLYRVPVQMVLIVTVKKDTGRKVDVVELQEALGNHVLMLYLTLKVRNDMERHRHVVHFPEPSLPIHQPLSPAPGFRILPALDKCTQSIFELRMKCVAPSLSSPKQ